MPCLHAARPRVCKSLVTVVPGCIVVCHFAAGLVEHWAQVSSAIMKGERPAIPDLAQPSGEVFARRDSYVALMQECWSQDPHDRPSFAEIVDRLRQAGVKACMHM